jgi:endogenous inhibitor of DNA gyrase (YacG/DUF329 family)
MNGPLPAGQRQAHGRKEKIRQTAPLPHLRHVGQFDDEDFPFCSDRCRKIDLGKWAMGVYKISSPVLDPEVLEDLGGLGSSQSGGESDSYDE